MTLDTDNMIPTFPASDAPLSFSGRLLAALSGWAAWITDRFNLIISAYNEHLTLHSSTGWDPGYETSVTLAFDDGTMTFSITPVGDDFSYFIDGVKYTKESSESVVITDTEGIWFFKYIGDTLNASQTPWDIAADESALVAIIYWDATNAKHILLGPELHTHTMDSATHHYLHYTFGTRWETGLAVSDNGSDQLDVTGGVIHDEDIHIGITDGVGGAVWEQGLTPAKMPIYYRDGATGDWRKVNSSTTPAYLDTNVLQYNEWTGAAWVWSPVDLNKYCAYWVIATNDQTEPVVLVPGQEEGTTLAAATGGNNVSDMLFGNLPSAEHKVIARVILQRIGASPYYSIEQIDDYRQIVDEPASSSAIAGDHGSMTGLADDDHVLYHNDTRGDARYYQKTEFLQTSTGVPDQGKPIKLDTTGYIDASMINDGDVDHGSIGGLTDDDHTQYHNDTRADTWLSGKDHSEMSDGGTNTHAEIDTHIATDEIHGGWTTIYQGAVTWQKIDTVGNTDVAIYKLLVIGGRDYTTGVNSQDLTISCRNGGGATPYVSWTHTGTTSYFFASIQIYWNSGTSEYDIWLRADASRFASCRAWKTSTSGDVCEPLPIDQGTRVTTTPSGSLVFDSGDHATYPPTFIADLTATRPAFRGSDLALKSDSDAVATDLTTHEDSGTNSHSEIDTFLGQDFIFDNDDATLNTLVVGDGTNGADFDANGFLSFNGSGAPYVADWIPATSMMKASIGNDPGAAKVADDGSGSTGVYTYAFDASSEEELHFNYRLPYNFLSGSNVSITAVWASPNTTSGTVYWGLEHSTAQVESELPNTTNAVVGSANSTTGTNKTVATSAWVISGSTFSLTKGFVINGRIYRDATNANDTYASDAYLLGIRLLYQVDSIGGATQYG